MAAKTLRIKDDVIYQTRELPQGEVLEEPDEHPAAILILRQRGPGILLLSNPILIQLVEDEADIIGPQYLSPQ